jgi:hypothetical protein
MEDAVNTYGTTEKRRSEVISESALVSSVGRASNLLACGAVLKSVEFKDSIYWFRLSHITEDIKKEARKLKYNSSDANIDFKNSAKVYYKLLYDLMAAQPEPRTTAVPKERVSSIVTVSGCFESGKRR